MEFLTFTHGSVKNCAAFFLVALHSLPGIPPVHLNWIEMMLAAERMIKSSPALMLYFFKKYALRTKDQTSINFEHMSSGKAWEVVNTVVQQSQYCPNFSAVRSAEDKARRVSTIKQLVTEAVKNDIAISESCTSCDYVVRTIGQRELGQQKQNRSQCLIGRAKNEIWGTLRTTESCNLKALVEDSDIDIALLDKYWTHFFSKQANNAGFWAAAVDLGSETSGYPKVNELLLEIIATLYETAFKVILEGRSDVVCKPCTEEDVAQTVRTWTSVNIVDKSDISDWNPAPLFTNLRTHPNECHDQVRLCKNGTVQTLIHIDTLKTDSSSTVPNTHKHLLSLTYPFFRTPACDNEGQDQAMHSETVNVVKIKHVLHPINPETAKNSLTALLPEQDFWGLEGAAAQLFASDWQGVEVPEGSARVTGMHAIRVNYTWDLALRIRPPSQESLKNRDAAVRHANVTKLVNTNDYLSEYRKSNIVGKDVLKTRTGNSASTVSQWIDTCLFEVRSLELKDEACLLLQMIQQHTESNGAVFSITRDMTFKKAMEEQGTVDHRRQTIENYWNSTNSSTYPLRDQASHWTNARFVDRLLAAIDRDTPVDFSVLCDNVYDLYMKHCGNGQPALDLVNDTDWLMTKVAGKLLKYDEPFLDVFTGLCLLVKEVTNNTPSSAEVDMCWNIVMHIAPMFDVVKGGLERAQDDLSHAQAQIAKAAELRSKNTIAMHAAERHSAPLEQAEQQAEQQSNLLNNVIETWRSALLGLKQKTGVAMDII